MPWQEKSIASPSAQRPGCFQNVDRACPGETRAPHPHLHRGQGAFSNTIRQDNPDRNPFAVRPDGAMSWPTACSAANLQHASLGLAYAEATARRQACNSVLQMQCTHIAGAALPSCFTLSHTGLHLFGLAMQQHASGSGIVQQWCEDPTCRTFRCRLCSWERGTGPCALPPPRHCSTCDEIPSVSSPMGLIPLLACPDDLCSTLTVLVCT